MFAPDLPQMTETQLASAYQRTHSGRYLGELYTRYYDNVFAYCLRFTHDREGALDIAQEVFLRAAERIGQLRHTELFAGWLFRIVRNECINFLKAKTWAGNIPETRGGGAASDYDPFTPSAAQEKEQLLDALQAALAESDEGCRALLKEKYVEGLPIAALQARYGLSESAVKMRLARARKQVHDKAEHIAAFTTHCSGVFD